MAVDRFREIDCTLWVGVENRQAARAELHERVCDRCPRAAGANQDDPVQGGSGKPADKGFAEAEEIRVVADGPSVAEDNRVHCAKGDCLRRELVEALHHELLARMGDVEPAEAHSLRLREKLANRVRAELELVEIDDLVDVPKTEAVGLGFVERRTERVRDSRTDESDNATAVGSVHFDSRPCADDS